MTNKKNDHALLIFIRNPELGKVKTRLAEDLGPEEALRIYRLLLAHTRQTAMQVPARRYLFYSNFIDREDDWPQTEFEKYMQNRGDLGDRMLSAFELALRHHRAVVIIGSDCPDLSGAIIRTAFERLQDNDFVIGPATDGGYYLLGMRRPHSELFLDMTWSHNRVFAETIRRMEELGASYYTLPTLADIDYAADWERYGGIFNSGQ